MRKLSAVSAAITVGIAFYFTLSWGIEGWGILTSPSYGLNDVWRSQFVFVIGSLFALTPIGLIKLAAFFGALKLAVAAVCAVHIIDRLRAMVFGRPDYDLFEGGLTLVFLISMISIGPAIWSQDASLVRETTIELMLAAIATALSLLERGDQPATAARPAVRVEPAATLRDAPWYSPFR